MNSTNVNENDYDGDDEMVITSIINERGVPPDRGTLLMTETQIRDFCNQKAEGLPLLPIHDKSNRIGTVKEFLMDKEKQWVGKMSTRHPETKRKVLNGEYIGCSAGVSHLATSSPNTVLAKRVKEISLTPTPDRENAQITKIEYKGHVYLRRRDMNTGRFLTNNEGKAVYGKFFLFIFFCNNENETKNSLILIK